MIKMTTELFEKFSKKQEELDDMIRTKFTIGTTEWNYDLETKHLIALKVEVAEFVNNCHDLWKYWKQKAVNLDMIIEEAVDVIHFIHLILNKKRLTSDAHIAHIVVERVKFANRSTYAEIIEDMLNTNDVYEIYAGLLLILDHYAFTLDDIEQAYDRKNAENHARQNRNY
ncbi:hypothetical protein CW689_01375 [Macrococcoides caseolyticum]|uniref:dUTP diphosphatase n=1 Tax=Macrococcoides caseolyticum TaxID=69966 RepID=UPI000C323B4F|nr:dUTP diphosphatase [Macrococcus caseolyticus]PKE25143.1 hypothetical protein CW689_01375 [Macrococcus caseolyticus]